MDNIYEHRIAALRALMERKGWDAVIIGGSDPHSSEYPSARWKQVQWLTGFTGEAGDVVVTQTHAGLWTDTRYFIQADRQLRGTGVELHKTRVPEQVLIPEWLAVDAFAGRNCASIAFDSLCQSVSAVRELRDALGEDMDLHLAGVPNLLDDLWEDRPAVPSTPVFELDECLSGESRASKIDRLREFLRSKNCDVMLLSALDEIAWVLNVRASDIEYNPMSISYLLVGEDRVRWLVGKGEGPLPELEGVECLAYDDILTALAEEASSRIFVDSSTLNYHIYNALPPMREEGRSPVGLMKAIKNATEIEGMREVHIQDGVAMECFLYWLEKSLEAGLEISEWDAACKLGELRASIEGYTGDSFETISASGAGAALPHYVTPRDGAPLLPRHGLYLCDSGGQYMRGTTDITRTLPLGPCSALEMEDYTLVLKGHIALARAVFPAGTPGCRLDVLARSPLWQARRNFGHGTGHGVGFFLGVHEGPQDIRQNLNPQPMLPGMITSDEPGIYREGMHGIRHENLLLCIEAGENGFGEWLCFEPLTLCHFDTSVIVPGVLSSEEEQWLHDYNEKVYLTLAPLLPLEVADWLREKVGYDGM